MGKHKDGKPRPKMNGRKRKEQLKLARSMKMKLRGRPQTDMTESDHKDMALFPTPPSLKQEQDMALLPTPPSLKQEQEDIPDMSQFSINRVLMEEPASKMMAVAGQFPDTPSLTAVVLAEKKPLTLKSLRHVFTADTAFSLATRNNIYSQMSAVAGGSVGDLKLLTIYPATEAHIKKYSHQVWHVVHETPQDYMAITRPFIESQSFDIQWVYNILEGKAEQDRIIFSDPDPDTGFVLLPDFKWDQGDLQNLYLLAICRRRNICSLRDLEREHLPLLRNIQERGSEAIYKKYGIPRDRLRAYIHYQPSYYHLHVHFTQLKYAAPKSSVGEAHLLHDVIDNIETIDPMYYQKRRLSFTVSESCLLWKAYQEHYNCSSSSSSSGSGGPNMANTS